MCYLAFVAHGGIPSIDHRRGATSPSMATLSSHSLRRMITPMRETSTIGKRSHEAITRFEVIIGTCFSIRHCCRLILSYDRCNFFSKDQEILFHGKTRVFLRTKKYDEKSSRALLRRLLCIWLDTVSRTSRSLDVPGECNNKSMTYKGACRWHSKHRRPARRRRRHGSDSDSDRSFVGKLSNMESFFLLSSPFISTSSSSSSSSSLSSLSKQSHTLHNE